MAAVYTKDELMALYPCFSCLSDTELMAVLIYVLSELNGKDIATDLPEMMDDSACYNCLVEKQMFQGMLAALAVKVLPDGVTVNQLRNITKCLNCVDPNRMRALALNEWTTYLETL